MDDDKGIDGLQHIVLDGFNNVFPVSKEGVETGRFILAFPEDVGSLALEPLVQLAVCNLECLFDMGLLGC